MPEHARNTGEAAKHSDNSGNSIFLTTCIDLIQISL